MDGLEAVFFPELCSSIGEAGGFNCFADCSENWAIAVAEVEFHFWIGRLRLARGLHPAPGRLGSLISNLIKLVRAEFFLHFEPLNRRSLTESVRSQPFHTRFKRFDCPVQICDFVAEFSFHIFYFYFVSSSEGSSLVRWGDFLTSAKNAKTILREVRK